jgi:hypothetical protein
MLPTLHDLFITHTYRIMYDAPYYDAPYSISLQLAQHHLQRSVYISGQFQNEHKWAAAIDVDLGTQPPSGTTSQSPLPQRPGYKIVALDLLFRCVP